MKEQLLKELLSDYRGNQNEMIEDYLDVLRSELSLLEEKELTQEILSELNYRIRRKYKSSELLGMKVRQGDICYIDFGKNYINEAGYQHFGLVLNTFNSKILVVPMSSNESMYHQAYCEETFPYGKQHLMRLQEISGLHRKSVLFLNDLKFINSSRIISIQAHLDIRSPMFIKVQNRIRKTLIEVL